MQIGFTPIPEWRSCYWHGESQVFLVVYVDDFKMSGSPDLLDIVWIKIRQHLEIEDPTPSGKYLG